MNRHSTFTLAIVAAISVFGVSHASAQNPSGRVITKKMLADCKQQAQAQKLSYLKRRKFIRDCVKI